MNVPRRTKSFGDKTLDTIIDQLTGALDALAKAVKTSAGAAATADAPTIFNDSGSAIARALVLGRAGDGRLSLARAGGTAAAIEPLLVSLADAGADAALPVAFIGVARVRLDGSDGAGVVKGAPVWLSTSPGRVSAARRADGRAWRVGTFASDEVDSDGTIEAWINIYPVGGRQL